MRAMTMSLLALTMSAGVAVAAAPLSTRRVATKITQATTSRAVTAALANPARADQQGDDARRQAAAVLALSGVKPGDTVIDYLPGGGYWTRIFSGVVGPGGHVYAYLPHAAGVRYAKEVAALQARALPNTTVEVQAANLPSAPKPVDLFWTVQNYHDIANAGGEAALLAFNKAVFATLKPGGIYVVIDHADGDGTGITGTSTRHRIDPSAAKAQIIAAGFVLVGQSSVLGNPLDDHSKKVFDPEIRGKTDQFVYKFRKP